MLRIRGVRAAALVVCALVLPSDAHADSLKPIIIDLRGQPTLQFSDTFSADNDFAEILFTVTSSSTFTAATTSYAAGGFDPMLFLFDSAGEIVTNILSDGSELPLLNDDADPFADEPVRDSLIQGLLSAGDYTLVLTQYFNYPHFPLGTGADFDASPDFDATRYTCVGVEDCAGFVDVLGAARSGAFGGSLTITPLEQPAPVPEPGTLALMATGIGWLAARRRTRDRSSPN